MGDQKVSIGQSSRPDVDLRTGGRAPSVVARPVAVGTPGLAISSGNNTQQLIQALDLQTFSAIGNKVLKESRDEEQAAGALAQAQNQEDWATAVASGKVSATANPWFIKGYQAQDGRVAGIAYYGEMRDAYSKSPAKGSDDPKVYEDFVQGFTKGYMEKIGKDRSADWMSGFQGEMQSAQKTLASEHVQQAEAAVIEKQAANTGAELNVILNSTKDPAAAAAAINTLGEKMRLNGMPAAAFEKVAAEAILAKAKLGDTNMLKALDEVTTGDGKGTLASNPKVVSARVDTENWITEKRRGDVRWAWANDDRQWTLQQREIAKQTQAREEERWQQTQAQWGRQEKTRSLMSQIASSTLSDPANAYANNRDVLKNLAEIDPKAAESSSAFIDGFLTRRERVPDAVERPVLAQLQKDMIDAAGNPTRQQQLLMDANRLFLDGKLGRETVARFIDDAQKFASWDPSTARKLQDPQVVRVRQAAAQVFTEQGATGVYGSKAVDALVTEQVIDRAVLDHLHKKPDATGAELAQVATQAMQSVLPTLSPNALGGGRAGDLSGKLPAAAGTLQRSQPQDGNTPPQAPRLTADQVLGSVEPADAQAFVSDVEAAYSRGGLPAMAKAIADFDAKVGIPGLGHRLIDKFAKPPATSKPK